MAWNDARIHTRPSEWVRLLGQLAGIGLFAALIYTYCNVLIEACVRQVK